MRWPTAAGGCRPMQKPASIPTISNCCWRMKTAASTPIAASIRWRWAARHFSSSPRGHIVSGGSTITMQLARLMEPRRERSLYAKLRQMVRAIEIERQLSKEQILDLYLALAPFGGNLEGVRAASIAYFGKEPKRLSLAEVGAAGGAAAIAGDTPARPPSGCRARRARPRARAHGRGGHRVSEDDAVRPRPIAGAATAQADADPGAAFVRCGDGRGEGYARHQADTGFEPAEDAGSAGARPRDRAGAEYFGRDHRGRQ